ncbi:MAG: SH3 domain-containing protein [Candidatus Neomarinimicrobiota bacterium]
MVTGSAPASGEPTTGEPVSGHLKVVQEGIIREGPAPYYKIAEKLPAATVIKAVEKTGEWYLVKTPSGKIGWIGVEAVVPVIDDEIPPTPAITPSPVNENDRPSSSFVHTDELQIIKNGFLLAGPNNTESILANLEAGLIVKKLETEADWYKIQLPIGLVGWANRNLFNISRPETPLPIEIKITLVKNGNLRQAPKQTAAILATLPVATVVTKIDSSGDWYKVITADGRTGWLNRIVFPRQIVRAPATKSDLTKTLKRNGNLRQEPSLKSPVIVVVPVNTSVTVIDSLPDWYRIRLSDQTTGWINKLIFTR